jgi:hypothetical protein
VRLPKLIELRLYVVLCLQFERAVYCCFPKFLFFNKKFDGGDLWIDYIDGLACSFVALNCNIK